MSFSGLPDELLLRVLSFLDVPELLATSRTSRKLRRLSLDEVLHKWRLRSCFHTVQRWIPQRPRLYTLQPPMSTIYLTRTHCAARNLQWSMVCIRLNRSLSRRPQLSTLVSANILPSECCKLDRHSGERVWGSGLAGALVERKRRLERENIKAGLRQWLERKARSVAARRDEGGKVPVLIWRFSKVKVAAAATPERRGPHRIQEEHDHEHAREREGKVSRLKRLFDNLGNGAAAATNIRHM